MLTRDEQKICKRLAKSEDMPLALVEKAWEFLKREDRDGVWKDPGTDEYDLTKMSEEIDLEIHPDYADEGSDDEKSLWDEVAYEYAEYMEKLP